MLLLISGARDGVMEVDGRRLLVEFVGVGVLLEGVNGALDCP